MGEALVSPQMGTEAEDSSRLGGGGGEIMLDLGRVCFLKHILPPLLCTRTQFGNSWLMGSMHIFLRFHVHHHPGGYDHSGHILPHPDDHLLALLHVDTEGETPHRGRSARFFGLPV